MSDNQETKVQRYTRRLANLRLVSVIIVAGLVVIGIGQVTGALQTIWDFIPAAERPPKIHVECHLALGPADIPSDGRIYVLSLWPLPIANGGGGFTEYFLSVRPGSELKWPSGMARTAQRCHLTNYGDAPVFNVEMAFGLTFLEAVRDEKQPTVFGSGAVHLSRWWPVYLAKINSGAADPFVFYITNQSQYFVQVSLPDLAAFQSDVEGERRTVRLIKPPDTPAAALQFSPIEVQ